MAALPWVLMGLALAIWAACAAKKSRQEKNGEGSEQKGSNYMTDGMVLGMSVGAALWLALDVSYCFGIGMLAGMAIGSCIKKEK